MARATRPVLFFDIDNTLYSKGKRIQHMMGDLIDKYFQENLSLSQKDAWDLHQKYYKEYGLAIEGLVRHHKVDPLEYNSQVDDALPLEDVLSPDPDLRNLLLSIDGSKVRMWLFTNAYINHAKRVVQLLGIDDLFSGITYCDYGARNFTCKPNTEMFEQAQRDANVPDVKQCYFIDDSPINCRAAEKLGWTTVHYMEPSDDTSAEPAAQYHVQNLHQLKGIFPQFFFKT